MNLFGEVIGRIGPISEVSRKLISIDSFVWECLDLKDSDQLKNEKFIFLTTKGRKTGKMHVVELWFANANDRIYLSHEGAFTDWMKNIEKDGSVKMKIGF